MRARSRRVLGVAGLALAVILLAGCGDDDASASEATATSTSSSDSESGSSSADGGQQFPDVVEVEVTPAGEGEFQVAATVSSPYDSPERYADAWRVLDTEGNELGVRELAHDHASEQPFTREETVSIPDDVDEITVEGRDLANGYGGDTATATVPHGDG